MTLTFDEAKTKLAQCNRAELRDHYFGDKEVYFTDKTGNAVAEGYDGTCSTTLHFSDGSVFADTEAVTLIKLGTLIRVERNDSQVEDYLD